MNRHRGDVTPRFFVVCLSVAACIAGAAAAPASAARTGSLTFRECWDATGGLNPCGAGHETDGLGTGTRPVAVSPDGNDVYAASRFNGGLVHFRRGATG